MLRAYETIYILRPDISDTDADRLTDRVKNTIRGFDGKILEVRNWGKKRLAYEVAHNQKGVYMYWRYAGNNLVVAELERVLRMLEPVLRFLTVKLSDEIKEAVEDIGEDLIPLRAKRHGMSDEQQADGSDEPRAKVLDDDEQEED